MNTVAAQDIKRRGMKAVEEALANGPVRVLRNNRPRYVVLSEADYTSMLNDLAEARLARSEADLKAGRVQRGNAAKLMAHLRKGE